MLIEAKNHGDVRTTDRTPTSYTFQVTNRCGCDLCSAAIISRAATGTVGSRKFQLPLWIASCSVHGSPRPAVTLTLTWPRTFIMLQFATHTHDVPAFSSPAFFTPAIWSHVFQSRVFSVPVLAYTAGLILGGPRRSILGVKSSKSHVGHSNSGWIQQIGRLHEAMVGAIIVATDCFDNRFV